MASDYQLFKAGEMVETKSFVKGYRGAWFRCKIQEIGWRLGQISAYIQYCDFPDEKITWIKMYQKNSRGVHLMLRPPYPRIYHESTMPDVNTITKVVVIINNAWKVGDLVDWSKDGCYWSGKVTKVLGNDKLKIELPPPPDGEGLSYEVYFKDLRPSLDWSPKDGWTVLKAMENENHHHCARVLKPGNQEGPSMSAYNACNGRRGIQDAGGPGGQSHRSASSDVSASSLKTLQPPDGLKEMEKQPLGTMTEKETPAPATNVESDIAEPATNVESDIAEPATNVESDIADNGIGKTSCSDSVSSSHIKNASPGMETTATGEDRTDNSGSLKKMKMDVNVVLNSMKSDTLEAAVLDLEELVHRVNWMKSVLEIGMPLKSVVRPNWKFLSPK